jgi:hypothetical protein
MLLIFKIYSKLKKTLLLWSRFTIKALNKC